MVAANAMEQVPPGRPSSGMGAPRAVKPIQSAQPNKIPAARLSASEPRFELRQGPRYSSVDRFTKYWGPLSQVNGRSLFFNWVVLLKLPVAISLQSKEGRQLSVFARHSGQLH